MVNNNKLLKAAKRLSKALDRLDCGCDEPGFWGWENGNGTIVGDEIEKARINLKKVINEIENQHK